MTTTTITSNSFIVYNKGLENYKKGFDMIFNSTSFKKNIVYRRYINGEDNLSGDKNYLNYNDYNIYAEIQFEGETKDVIESGYVISSFGFIYLPTIISTERDGTEIPSFRPQHKDEFQFDGSWYTIQNIQPNQFASTPLSVECLFRLISTGDNPR